MVRIPAWLQITCRLMLIFLVGMIGFFGSAVRAENQSVDLDYLLKKKEVVDFYNSVNHGYLLALQACVNYEIARESLQRAGPLNSIEPPTFIREMIAVAGNTFSEPINCDLFINGILKEKVQRGFRRALEALAFAEPTFRDDNPAISEAIDSEPQFKINVRPDHPVANFAVRPFSQIALLPGLTENQITRFVAKYDQKTKEYCSEFLATSRAADLYQNLSLNNFLKNETKSCEALTHLDWSQIQFSTSTLEFLVREIQKKFFEFSKVRRTKDLREKMRLAYYRVIDENPMILLIQTLEPNLHVYRSAIDATLENQKKVANYSAFGWGPAQWKSLRDRHQANQLTARETEEATSKIEDLATFEIGEADTQTLLGLLHPDKKDLFKQTADKIRNRVQIYERRKFYAMMAGVVAINSTCFFPFRRWLSLFTAVATKTACLLTVGIPLNTYFLIDSYVEYKKSSERFLTTVEGRYALEKSQMLDAESKQVLAGLLLLPVGIEARRAAMLKRYTIRALGRTSAKIE